MQSAIFLNGIKTVPISLVFLLFNLFSARRSESVAANTSSPASVATITLESSGLILVAAALYITDLNPSIISLGTIVNSCPLSGRGMVGKSSTGKVFIFVTLDSVAQIRRVSLSSNEIIFSNVYHFYTHASANSPHQFPTYIIARI